MEFTRELSFVITEDMFQKLEELKDLPAYRGVKGLDELFESILDRAVTRTPKYQREVLDQPELKAGPAQIQQDQPPSDIPSRL